MNLSVNVTVAVSEPVDVTGTVSGKSPQTQSCTPSSCPAFSFSSVSPGGSYTVTASDGSKVTGAF